MDWIKIPTDSILYSEFKDSELVVIIKYQALYCQLEKEPTDAQLARVFNKKEMKLIQSHKEVVQELCENQINSVSRKRNRDKENYKQKQTIDKNSASGTNAKRARNGVADKIREDKKEKINKKEFSFEFEEFWKEYPKDRAGSKDKAFSAYERAIKEGRSTVERLLDSVKKYASSTEVERGFAKGCAAWLNDDRFNVRYEQKTQDDDYNPFHVEIPVCVNHRRDE